MRNDVDAGEQLSGDSTFPSCGIIVSARGGGKGGRKNSGAKRGGGQRAEGRQWKAIKSVSGKLNENYGATRGSLLSGSLSSCLLLPVKMEPRFQKTREKTLNISLNIYIYTIFNRECLLINIKLGK